MKIKTIIIILLLLLRSYSYAEETKYGARSVALSGASVSLVDIWANYNNQAALAYINKAEIGIFYINHFAIKELSTKAIAGMIPSRYGNFNFNISQFGYSHYNETKMALGFAKQLFKNLSMGLQLDRLTIKQAGINGGSLSAYTFEIGILSKISENINIGFHIFNPSQTKFSTDNNNIKIPSVAKLGLSWKVDKYFLLTSQSQINLEKNINLALGIEYYLNTSLIFRCGITNSPKSVSLGLSYIYNKISCNIAFWRHQTLSYSPSADIVFTF